MQALLKLNRIILIVQVLIFFYTSVSLGEAKKSELPPVYLSKEQRLALALAIELANPSLDQSEFSFESISKKITQIKTLAPQVIYVNSFEAFLNEWRGSELDLNDSKTNFGQLLTAESFRLRVFKSNNIELQTKIFEYMASHNQKLWNFIKSIEQDEKLFKMLNLENFNHLNLSLVAQNFFKEIWSQLDIIGQEISSKAFANNTNPTFKIMIQTVFKNYFSSLSFQSKKQLILALLSQDLSANKIQIFSTLLQNSGPQLQKMIQIVARQPGLDPELAAIFQSFENGAKAVPAKKVKEIIAADSSFNKFESIVPKPIGVGTMAQVHLATIQRNGHTKKIVIRFLKPDIARRVEEDHKILLQIATELDNNPEFRATGAPKITPLINEISNTVRAELDIISTSKRQIQAKKIYKKSYRKQEQKSSALLVHFDVPNILNFNTQSHLQIQEAIEGEKLETVAHEYREAYPELKKTIAEALVKMWTKEMILESGFYHADLHRGNFLVSMKESEVHVGILDYGMAGQIHQEMQENFIALASALELKDAKKMTRFFWNISNQSNNKVTLNDLEKAISKELFKIKNNQGADRNLKMWTAFAIDLGLAIPYDFVNINRGIVILDNLLYESGSQKTVSSISADLMREEPIRMTKLYLKKDFSIKEIAQLGLQEGLIALGLKENHRLQTRPEVFNLVNLRCEKIFQ